MILDFDKCVHATNEFVPKVETRREDGVEAEKSQMMIKTSKVIKLKAAIRNIWK